MSLHAARLAASERLKRVAALLSDGRARTTLEIVAGAGVCAVNSAVAELRANGVPVRCWREGNLWFYQLERSDPS